MLKIFDTVCKFYTDLDDIDTADIIDTEIIPASVLIENDTIIYDAESGTDDIWMVMVRLDISDPNEHPLRCLADFPNVEDAAKFEYIVRLILKLKQHV